MTPTSKKKSTIEATQEQRLCKLQKIIAAKGKSESDLFKITEKVDACLASMLENNETYSLKFETLQEAETRAAEILDHAEEALINYQPATAEEYGLQAMALVDSFLNDIENPSYAEALKRGAAQLSRGGFE